MRGWGKGESRERRGVRLKATLESTVPKEKRQNGHTKKGRNSTGFPSTVPPPVCVSTVLGTLAVWIQTQKIEKS